MPRRKTISSALTLACAALALTFGLAGFAAGAKAQDAPKLLGKYDDWSAYTYGSGNDRMCYAMTTPVKMLPAGANRGDARISLCATREIWICSFLFFFTFF